MNDTSSGHIPGPAAVEIFMQLKERYRVRQAQIAKILGIPRQVITDMKSGKRLFTWAMSEKLLNEFQHEQWGGWLQVELVNAFWRHGHKLPKDWHKKHIPDVPGGDLDAAMQNLRKAATPENLRKYPVRLTPVTGDPETDSELVREHIPLPPTLETQAKAVANSYILQVGFDTGDGRLRRGDLVLVVQDPERESEIMLVKSEGVIHFACRARHCGRLTEPRRKILPEDTWIALESGQALPAGCPVGCVVGIVMALL